MSATTMICAYCGSTCRWPDDFPSHIEACCRECWPKLYPVPRPSPWKRVRAWMASATSKRAPAEPQPKEEG